MDLKNHVYGSDIVISQHTNRPVLSTECMRNKFPIFWCGICKLELNVPVVAIQHMNGRSHRAKVNGAQIINTQNQNDASKRKRGLDSDHITPSKQVIQELPAKKSDEQTVKAVVQQPATKKGKMEQPAKVDPNLKCEDCNIVFDNIATAIPHFKGKRHVSKIAAKIESAKQKSSQNQKSGQRGGRGRGAAWGYGVGSIQRGGHGLFGGKAAAGELLGALKKFYGNPLYSGHSNYSGSNEYGTAQQLNGESPQSKEYFNSNEAYIHRSSKDTYHTHQVPLSSDSQAPKISYSRGSSYNRYGSNTFYTPNEFH